MNIIAIHDGHNASVVLLKEGQIVVACLATTVLGRGVSVDCWSDLNCGVGS
jgi:hypothetical protein